MASNLVKAGIPWLNRTHHFNDYCTFNHQKINQQRLINRGYQINKGHFKKFTYR